MSRAAEPFRGWTLAEGSERTADPELWKAWITAKNAWEKGRVPAPSSPSAFLNKSPQEIQTLRKAAGDAFQQIRDGLWRHLTDEKLAAVGSRGSGSETPTPIHSAGWQSLIVKDWEKSILQERVSKNKIFNVCIFPILHSTDAHARLANCSLSGVFRKFVIEDPEIASLGKRVIREDKRHVSVFREGQHPGLFSDFKWPFDLTARDLALNFVDAYLSSTSSPRRASDVIENVSRVIVSRWQALRGILIGGKIIARGTFSATGVVGVIDPLQWERAGLWIDVRNGDLLEEENNKPTLRWSGLALMAPPSLHVKPAVSDGLLPSTTEPHASTKKSIVRVERDQATVKACIDWLVQIMRASKNERTHSKRSLWNEAQEKWRNSLSHRSFLGAWTEAIRISGAIAWGAAGAPRKSNRRAD